MASITDKDKKLLWHAGRLAGWKLHSGQRELYKEYRDWEKSSFEARERGEAIPGLFPRIFVADCARRFGKDYVSVVIRIEDALRNPGNIYTYGTAFAKDINEIVLPLVEKICSDCPPDLRPQYKTSYQGTSSGLYFPNKSIIRLVGIDRNPDGLRGRFSDGVTISEGAFVDHLKNVVQTILLPQLQGRRKATIFLNSTPPVIPGHPWDDLFCPDAKERGAYILRTIDANPLLTDSEREEFIQAAGGRESETCRREYYCERIRSETRVVIPEFDISRHVKDSPLPPYLHAYTVIDPGIQDICAVGFCYWDFERAKLVIRGDWGKRNAPTNTVVEAIREGEKGLWGSDVRYWDGTAFKMNPFLRFSDTDSRLITDLNHSHNLKIGAADKDGAEAALHSVRNAFQRDRIEIHPLAQMTIDHLSNAVWNKSRTSYERNDLYGHYDAVDVVKYAWRMIPKERNPFPPAGITLLLEHKGSVDDIFHRKEHFKSKSVSDKIRQIMPASWSRKR